MSNYVWNASLSYADYLQTKYFFRDVVSASKGAGQEVSMNISRQTREIIASNEALARENIAAQKAMAREIAASHEALARENIAMQQEMTGAIQGGFETLNYNLSGISYELSRLNARFEWGFSEILAQLGHMNDTLQELVKIAKTPVQTVAFNHFEIARDAFRQGLYKESLEELGKAINGDHTSSGYKLEWRFHNLTGVIRLGFAGCDISLMNLAQAEEAFLAAGRYARTDYPQDAGQAFLSAGWAAYCQGKMNEALNHTEQAINASSILVEALFQASKILMAINRPQNALPYLGKAIETDRFFALKAAGDGDFQKHESELRNFLETMRKEKYKQISKTLPEMIKKIEHVRYPANVIELKTRMERALREGKTWPLMDVLSIEQEWRSIILNRCVLLWIKKKSEILPNQVPETVYVTETYQEQVLVRPGGFFRKPQYREETRTRQVQKVKMVNKTISLELHIIGHVDEPQATMEFVRIPAGEFIMGEGGGHSVILTQDFWMGRYPVTQAYWKAVMGNTPGHFKGDNHPVDSVSWDDVQDFIKVLNKMIGESRYCLPTEAQWEYACRAGTTTAYYTGDSEEDLTRAGWYEKNSGSQTHPVGEKEPNAWGLYDMHGNVFEWCNDWYGAYPSGTVTDPAGPVSGSLRVIRGGAWDFDAGYCRSASRYWRDPADRGGYLGFRLVLLPGR